MMEKSSLFGISQYHDLLLIYTNQCPYIGKANAEMPTVAEQHGTQLHLVELNNAAEAREKCHLLMG